MEAGQNQAIAESKSTSKYVVIYEITDKFAETWMNPDGSIGCEDKEQMPTIYGHFQYMDQLHSEGIVVTGGPLLKTVEEDKNQYVDGAMIVYEAQSREELDKLVGNDPFISTGIMEVESKRLFHQGK